MIQNNKRILLFDALKSVSALFMTIFHSTLFQQRKNNYYKDNKKYTQYFINCCYATLTRTCSPLFMMVTGCLLLSPKRMYDRPSVHRIYYFKRLKQYLFWVFPYFYDEFKSYDWKNNFEGSIISVIYQYIDSHKTFWYMKILLTIHLITPAVQASLRNMKRNELEFFLVIYFFSYFGINQQRLVNEKRVNVNNFGTLFFYFILGPYLFQSAEYAINESSPYVSRMIKGDSLFPFLNKIDMTKKNIRIKLLLLILLTVFYGAFFDWFHQMHGKINGYYYIETTNPLCAILSSLIFLFFFSCFRKWESEKNYAIILSKFFYSSGSCSMGIYMMNELIIFKIMFYRVFPLLKLNWYGMNTLFFPPLMGTFAFVVCWRLSKFMKKIPFLKDVIY